MTDIYHKSRFYQLACKACMHTAVHICKPCTLQPTIMISYQVISQVKFTYTHARIIQVISQVKFTYTHARIIQVISQVTDALSCYAIIYSGHTIAASKLYTLTYTHMKSTYFFKFKIAKLKASVNTAIRTTYLLL